MSVYIPSSCSYVKSFKQCLRVNSLSNINFQMTKWVMCKHKMVINQEKREKTYTYTLHIKYARPCKWKNPKAVNDSAFTKNPALNCPCIPDERVWNDTLYILSKVSVLHNVKLSDQSAKWWQPLNLIWIILTISPGVVLKKKKLIKHVVVK